MTFGFFNGMVTVNGNIITAQSVSRDFRSRAFGVLNSVLPLGSVTGPIIGGALGDSLGLGSSFFASAGVFFLSAGAFSLLQKRSEHAKSPEPGNTSNH
jgi:MFS family permease